MSFSLLQLIYKILSFSVHEMVNGIIVSFFFGGCKGENPQDQTHHSDCTPQLMPDPLQDDKECENNNEMVSTSQVNAENIPQDGSEVIKLVFSCLLQSSEGRIIFV